MYKVAEAINSFAADLDVEVGLDRTIIKFFAEALIEDARDHGQLLSKTEPPVTKKSLSELLFKLEEA